MSSAKSSEKICPKCAEGIKKAAVVCKHCGYHFSEFELSEQKKRDELEKKRGGLGCLAIIAIIVGIVIFGNLTGGGSKNHTSTKSANVQNEQLDMARYQVAAKKAMESSLRDPGRAQYKDVRAHKTSGGSEGYVFCGLVNAVNGFGGYTGLQRFVAGPGVAATEDMVSDFHNLWNELCSGSGTSVWF